MLCQRCKGLLIRETFEELRAEIGRICLATRCVNCGCIENSVVRAIASAILAKRSVSQGMVTIGEVVFLRPPLGHQEITAVTGLAKQ